MVGTKVRRWTLSAKEEEKFQFKYIIMLERKGAAAEAMFIVGNVSATS